jgi:hypothetical protein
MGSELPQPSPALSPERQARLFAFIRRAVAGERPECDPDTAAHLAGMVVGMRAALIVRMHGATPEQAKAATMQWVRDQEKLYGSLAAPDDGKADGNVLSRWLRLRDHPP